MTVIHKYVKVCILKDLTFEDYRLKNDHKLVHQYFGLNIKCCSEKFVPPKKNGPKKIKMNEFDILFKEDQTKSKHKNEKKNWKCCCVYVPNPIELSSMDITLTHSIIDICEEGLENHKYEISRMKQIKDKRNEIFHMSDSKSVDQKKFEEMWNNLSDSVQLIANKISKEEGENVQQQISVQKTLVRVSEDDMKQLQLYRYYWRDKCLECEQQLTEEFDKIIDEVFKEILNVDDETALLGSTAEKIFSEDGLYEIELHGNVAMNKLINEKNETARSGIKEGNSSIQTRIDADINKISENKAVKDNDDDSMDATTSTSIKDSKLIPVLFKIEVPNDWDTEKAIKALELMRTSSTDDKDIKIKSYALYDLQIIAEIIKKRLTKPIIMKFINKMLKGIQPNTTEKELIKVSILAPEKLTLKMTTQKEKIIKGSSHNIKCEISGNPEATKIRWTQNGIERKGEDSASLVFDEFQPTDEGCYICYATNAAGTSESGPLFMLCIEKPIVHILSEQLQMIKGSNHIIKCFISGKPLPSTLSWKKRIHGDETTVDLTGEKYSGGTVDCPELTIKDFDISDEGTYICQAINEAGEGCSEELFLECIDKPVVEIYTAKPQVTKGSIQILTCKVFGKSQPSTLSWKKRLNEVETTVDLTGTKYSGGTVECPSLTIIDFDISDEGTYKCQAINEAGEGCSNELHIVCIEKPVVQIYTEKQPVIKGSNQIIQCSVSGKQQPSSLSWKKRVNGNDHVETTVDLTGEKYSGGTVGCPSLTIKDFDMSDEGTYTCQATNDAGEGCSKELLLKCIEKPNVQIYTDNQQIIKGSNQIIQCTVFGKPFPSSLSWKKRVNGDEQVETTVDLTGRKYSGGTVDCPSLTINDFDMSDEGTYSCQAINEAGEDCSKELLLECIKKPEIVITISADEQQVNKESDFTLACTISGTIDKNEISWIKNTKKVDIQQEKYSGGTINFPSLTIKNFDKEDEGTYICQAANKAGGGKSKEILLSCIGKKQLNQK
ncbi:cell adhesion molecule DSCAML1-like [Mytilus edulis]|uniref:cell adhesion molecule DSCAML1-like n=1 Tax=Mytilus edulis TaxID=6550 RepID=UPI0039F10D95